MSQPHRPPFDYTPALVNTEHLSWFPPAPPGCFTPPHLNLQPHCLGGMVPLDLSYQHEHAHSSSSNLLFPNKPCINQEVTSPGKLTYYDMDTRQSHLVSAQSCHSARVMRGPPDSTGLQSGITSGIPRLPSNITKGSSSIARGPPDIIRNPFQLSVNTEQLQPATAHQRNVSFVHQQSMVRTPKAPDSTGKISLSQAARNKEGPLFRHFLGSSQAVRNQPVPTCPSPARSKQLPTAPRERSTTTSPLESDDLGLSAEDSEDIVEIVAKPSRAENVSEDISCDQLQAPTMPSASRSRSRRPVDRYQVTHDYRRKRSSAIDLIGRRQSNDKPKNYSKFKACSNMADSVSSAQIDCDNSPSRICKDNKPQEETVSETPMVPDSTTELLTTPSPSSPFDLELRIAEQLARSIALPGNTNSREKSVPRLILEKTPLSEAAKSIPLKLICKPSQTPTLPNQQRRSSLTSPTSPDQQSRPSQMSPTSTNQQRKPSQASPNLYKALTKKLPPKDRSVKRQKNPEKEKPLSVNVSTESVSKDQCTRPAHEEHETRDKKFGGVSSEATVSKMTTDNEKVKQPFETRECLPETPCESQSPSGLIEEPETPIIGRRRKVCQTDFFRVVYPEPKRRKSTDPGKPTSKAKTTKDEKITTPVQSKIHKDTANLLTAVTDTPALSTGSIRDLPVLESSGQSSAVSDQKQKKKQEEEETMEGRTIGRIVWAKLTARSKAWPAVTIKNTLAAQSPASPDHQWVFWYGEHKVSEVPLSRLQDFDVAFKSCFKPGSGSLYQSAVLEALRDSWTQLNKASDQPSSEAMPDGLDAFLEWSEERFSVDESILSSGKVSEEVGGKLIEIVEMINEADDSAEECDGDTDQDYRSRQRNSTHKSKKEAAERKVAQVSRATMISKVKLDEIDLESICISCGRQANGSSAFNDHPLFKGSVCKACMYHVKDSFFSFGSDGCMSYCVICGHGGELLVCDSKMCGRTYCVECIEVLGNEQLLEDVKESDPWACFLCEPMNSEEIVIQTREDWKQRLMKFYQKPSKLHNLPAFQPDRKLRVISLFDGIGTAKVALDKLNLDIDVYYSLEIEEDAIQVVNLNHGETVLQLGDIREFTEEKLVSLGRIDLLVGGSPCNDLALVNPARKGLYDSTGTGILFFDFYRVLMTLMSQPPNHSVLWLFENVVHMNKETKETISRFLECEPVKIDAGVFSPQSRPRYFWGNIPGMFCPISPEMLSLNIRLQDVLSNGREAAVSKIRTVTTRGASLLQGKNEDTHAVVMNGQSDKLWPTELEKVFGLPVHYTDAGNLAPGKRQKLLGRAWCVPVIEHLLKPLTHLFSVKPAEEPCTCKKK